MRYGIIGTGMMGIEHVASLRALDGARVVALADPHEPSLGAAVAALGEDAAGVHVYGDHRELLDSGGCDAVVIASPNMTHADVLVDVLATDVHVLVEKPLCTTVEDCRRVAAAAEGRRALVAVGLEYRFMPSTARFVAEVRGGTVGRLRMLAIREHRFPFLVKVGDWNRFNRNTGGTLVEKCCHFFDLMRLVAGSDPVRLLASGGQSVNHLDEVYGGEVPDILDNAYVIVDFADGVRALLDLCMFAEATHHSEELVAVGDRGKVEALLPQGTVRVGRRGEHWIGGVEHDRVADDRVRYEGFHHGACYLEHADLLEAIRAGRRPAVGLDDGLWSVAMGVAAHRSIDEGRVVTMDEVLG
ncbi:MAG: Gfo/Idh/MocA family oxidoreductase [Acidimicrobiales bacterium]|nr:Gfo/Idh/MocA family oxidoreductase [Acidimicrobiales bacterium]